LNRWWTGWRNEYYCVFDLPGSIFLWELWIRKCASDYFILHYSRRYRYTIYGRRKEGALSMIRKTTTYILLLLTALVLFFPILYAISASFMQPQEIYAGKLLPTTFNFDAYREVFANIPLMHYLTVSFWMSFIVMVGQLIVCSLAAYAFVFIPFKGRNIIFFIFLSTMLIPWEATIIPNFLTMVKLDWINKYQGLTFPFLALTFEK